MSETISNNIIKEVKKVSIGKIGVLRITKDLQKIINYLHYKVGSTEWSGILFYKISKGNIDNLKDLEVLADFIYPMNIGSHAYTEFEYNGEIINAYDIHKEGISMSTGLIHSHHNMSTFFSNTDLSELETNAYNYNYYVSLIVNFSHEYCAKIAVPSKSKTTRECWFKNTLGKLTPFKNTKEEDILLIGDLEVIIDNNIENPEWLKNRIKILEDKKKELSVANISSYSDFEYPYNHNSTYRNSLSKVFNKSSTIKDNNQIISNNNVDSFLSAWLNLDVTKSNNSIEETLKYLGSVKDADLDILENSLDINLELIHESIYNSPTKLGYNCIKALNRLMDFKDTYENKDFFEIIKNILITYIE